MNRSAAAQLKSIVGPDHFSDQPEECLCYAYDATQVPYLPDAVIFPADTAQVSQIMQAAHHYRFPVVPRGKGSGFSGGALPVQGGVVMDMHRFNRILSVDVDNLVAEVEPAVVTAHFQAAVQAKGLFYPPDPASYTFCSLGGNIAENAGGMRAVKYGVTKNYVMGLEVVLPDGEIIRTGSACVKDVVGYDLTTLFVGSEGTLGVITAATLKLLPLPAAKQTLTATFGSMVAAARVVSRIIGAGIIPTTLEFLDGPSLRAVESHRRIGLPVTAEAFLLVEVDGEPDHLDGPLGRVAEICRDHDAMDVRIARDKKAQEDLWRARREVAPALRKISPIRMNEDIVVPRSRIPDMIAYIRTVADQYRIPIINYGHAGDGNIHINVMAGPGGEADRPKMEKAVTQILSHVDTLGGRISGEHGIGLSKLPFIHLNMDPATLALSRRLKRFFDPLNILNPGKMFPPA